MRLALAAFGAVLVLLLGGCGGDDDDSTDAADTATATDSGGSDTDSGGSDTDSGGSDTDSGSAASGDPVELDGLDVPLAPGAQILFEDSDDTVGLRTVLYTVPAADFDATIAFYDDWTSSQTEDYQRTSPESGGAGWITAGTQILVLGLLDGDTEAQVQIIANT